MLPAFSPSLPHSRSQAYARTSMHARSQETYFRNPTLLEFFAGCVSMMVYWTVIHSFASVHCFYCVKHCMRLGLAWHRQLQRKISLRTCFGVTLWLHSRHHHNDCRYDGKSSFPCWKHLRISPLTWLQKSGLIMNACSNQNHSRQVMHSAFQVLQRLMQCRFGGHALCFNARLVTKQPPRNEVCCYNS